MSAPQRPSRAARVRWLVAAAAVCLASARAHAQVLTGVLRGPEAQTGLPGVVVSAVHAGTGAPVGRTLTGPSGSFRLLLGTDSVIVRALRIGQRPTTLFEGRLRAGEQRTVDMTLLPEPVAISAARVRERDRCGRLADDGGTISSLFLDVLTALSAVSVSDLGDVDPPRLRTLRVEETRDRRDRVQRVGEAEVLEGVAVQPFRSVPVDVILEEGFVQIADNGDRVFRAPDALVLIDERFLERTCLSLDRSRETSGQLGVRFAPARRERGRVDVRGVLWLDASTRELERLEFGYLGLDREAASTSPGGTVDYLRLPDGRWIIERWELRMPSLVTEYGTDPSGRARLPRMRAVGARVQRGFVTHVRAGDQVLYSVGGESGEAALLRALREAEPTPEDGSARTGTASSLAALGERVPGEATDDASIGLLVAVRDADDAARTGVRVEAEWRGRYRVGATRGAGWERERVIGTTQTDGAVLLCGIPRSQPVTVRAVAAGCPPVTTLWRPVDSATEGAVTLRLSARCGR